MTECSCPPVARRSASSASRCPPTGCRAGRRDGRSSGGATSGVFGPGAPALRRRRAHRPRPGAVVGDRRAGEAAARGTARDRRSSRAWRACERRRRRDRARTGRARAGRDRDRLRAHVRLDREAGGRAGARHRAARRPRRSKWTRARSSTSSAGYHPRHTAWKWSAGVGKLTDGRSVGWNLVTGIHDSPSCERADDLGDGEPAEVGPGRVRRRPRARSRSRTARELRLHEWAAREDRTNVLLMRSYYRQPFGTFAGAISAA